VRRALGLACALLLFLIVVYGGAAYQVQRTVLSTEFAFAEIERADPVRMMKSTVLEYLTVDASPVLIGAIDAALAEQRPWLVAELRQAAVALQDYLRGAAAVQVVIDPAPLRAAVLQNVDEVVQAGAGPELERLPLDGREALSAAVRSDSEDAFAAMGTFRFDSDTLPPLLRVQLSDTRRVLAVFQPPLILVVCAVVAVGFLAGALGQLRMAGLAVLAAGVVLLLPVVFSSRLAGLLPLESLSMLPGVVAAYLPAFSEHLMAPLGPIVMAALVTGAGLFGLSFAIPAVRSERR
jgi:hypothetical protein